MRTKNIVDDSLVSPAKQVLESESENTDGSDSEEGNKNVGENDSEDESDGGDEGSDGVGEENNEKESVGEEKESSLEGGEEEVED